MTTMTHVRLNRQNFTTLIPLTLFFCGLLRFRRRGDVEFTKGGGSARYLMQGQTQLY